MPGSFMEQTIFSTFWRNPQLRNPLLFSLGVHVFITGIIFFPTSFFQRNRTPEIYSVELIDLSEPMQEPETPVQSPPPPKVQPTPVVEPAVSTQPVLSTRTIPQVPTEIKIIRPRAVKKDLRKDRPPIDQSMVLAALQRLQSQEKEQQAQVELDRANEAVEQAKEEMLQTLRNSILTRPSQTTSKQVVASRSTPDLNATGSTPQTGQVANTVLLQYIATVNNHIGQHWRLPEGQKWDESLRATVIVKIRADGIVTSAKFEQQSTSRQFDKFVDETIEKASPLPPVPSEIANKDYALRLHFYPKGLQ